MLSSTNLTKKIEFPVMDKQIRDLRHELAKKYQDTTELRILQGPSPNCPQINSGGVVKKKIQTIHSLSSINGRRNEDPVENKRIDFVEAGCRAVDPHTNSDPHPSREAIENIKQRIIRGAFLEEENVQLKKEIKRMKDQIEKLSENGLQIKEIKEVNSKILSAVLNYGPSIGLRPLDSGLRSSRPSGGRSEGRPPVTRSGEENIRGLSEDISNCSTSERPAAERSIAACDPLHGRADTRSEGGPRSICLVGSDLTKLRQDINIYIAFCKKLIARTTQPANCP